MGLGDSHPYSKTNIINLQKLRRKLQQDRMDMFKSDEEFRRGYYRCVFYESLCTREDKLESLVEKPKSLLGFNIIDNIVADMSTVDDNCRTYLKTEAIRSEFKESSREILSWFDQDWERKKGKPIILEEKTKK